MMIGQGVLRDLAMCNNIYEGQYQMGSKSKKFDSSPAQTIIAKWDFNFCDTTDIDLMTKMIGN